MRPLRNVQQRVFAIGKIQNPKPRVHFLVNRVATGRPVQTAPAQLRLAVRIQVAVAPVIFKDIQDSDANAQRFRELVRVDKFQVVCRSVVFRKTSPYTSHQAPYRKIKSGRAILAFIVAIRREFQKLRGLAFVSEHMHCGTIDLSISAAALLIVELALVANAGQNQAVANSRRGRLVPSEPSDCPDGSRNEQEPVGVAKILFGKILRQEGSNGEARKIVIGQRGMTDMAGNEHLVRGTSRQVAFPKRQVTVLEGR